ncbi:type II toxin-antitoxin system RelE/ParE family toxin [Aquibaculum arenosum]|uniref:type II toxin-antitoxin system RelE/ParE family toxin n=1 Tax=Aquibaculum arenosum TaxID=3032591 RepID=UPI00345FC7A6
MSYAVWLHPAVAGDFEAIGRWLFDYAGPQTAVLKLSEIEAAVMSLAEMPHRGSVRDEIAPGLRAIPVGRKAVVAFSVDDARREVMVYSVTYGGADWMSRSVTRQRSPHAQDPD